jgi:DNA-binding winged helix-turn-helix (wHTH) protein
MEPLIFGQFRLDRASYSLARRVQGEPVQQLTLRPKAFDVLRYLVESPGRIVSQDEFLAELWPETYVQPEVLKGHVLAVRTALDDRAAPARYIETVRGRGYRFIAEVRTAREASSPDRGAGTMPDRTAPAADMLVGRAAARTELERAFARARRGEAQIVFVTGEAGIGKTALVETFIDAAAAEGATVVTGHCLPGSGETDAYYPILEMLTALSRGSPRDDLTAVLTSLAPTWLVQLPALMAAAPMDPRRDVIGATPHRMARELCDALDALARDTLLLLFVEDLHWADQATLDLIHALGGRRMRTQLMVVATLRTSVSTEAGRAAGTLAQKLSLYRLAREIRLDPLGFEDVEAFLSEFARAAPPLRLARHLYDRSEGNPLFMRAMLDSLLQHKLVSWDHNGWKLEAGFETLGPRAPSTLAQVIEAEISDLPPEERLVLEAASVSDGIFSASVHHVASAVDEQKFEAVCEAMSRRGQLLRRGDVVEMPNGGRVQTFGFRHALFQEVAYDRQGATRRARSHAAVAEHLATMFATDLSLMAPSLARHCLHAGLWRETIRYLRVTARTAMQRFALREAAALLEQAIALSRNLSTGERGETELGLLEELAGNYLGRSDPRAEITYDRLARLARDLGRVDVEARALLGVGFVVGWSNRDLSLEVMSQALSKSSEIADPVQRARVRCSAHGWRSWVQGWSAADAEGLRAAIAELEGFDDPLALAASEIDHSVILFLSSRYVEGIEVAARAIDVLAAHAHEAQVDLNLPIWVTRLGTPWAQMTAGRFGEALDGFAAGFAACEANGDVGRGATLRLYEAFAHERMHDHCGALDILDATLIRLQDNGVELTPNETKIERVVRGLAELGLGQVEAAFRHLTAATAEMTARNTLTSWYWRLAVDWGMTDAHLAAGDLAAAETCAREFMARTRAIEERTWRALAAEASARVALALGDPASAGSHLSHAWAEIAGYDTPLVRWRLYAVEALVSDARGEPDAADRHRRSRADELSRLVATLPAGHAGRDTLKAAQPFMPRPKGQNPSHCLGSHPPSDGKSPVRGMHGSALPIEASAVSQ